MIPTILIVAVPLGIVWGFTRSSFVVAVGVAITLLGWVLLVAIGTDELLTAGFLLSVALLGLINLGLGVGVGWVVAVFTRRLFGMTSEP